jgi:hypothetical protein
VTASGDNRVNEKAMAVHAGEKLHRPDAEFLCLHTSLLSAACHRSVTISR